MKPQNQSLFILLVSIVFTVSTVKAIENRTINILPEYINEICGETFSDRIISGKNAKLGQFPWMARIDILGEKNNQIRPLDQANQLMLFFSIQMDQIIKDSVFIVVVH